MNSRYQFLEKLRTDRVGFTLVELLAGIALSAILFLSLYEFVFYYASLGEDLRRRSQTQQKRQVLTRLLYQDLTALPVGKPNFTGDRHELSRTTVALESDRQLNLETRVRYFVDPGQEQTQLMREWKWTDVHTDTQPAERLLTADRIRFRYRGPHDNWHSRTTDPDTITAVQLSWQSDSIVVPTHR